LAESRQRGANGIEWIASAKRLGNDIVHADRLNNSSHSATGNNTGTVDGRL
jgi:hypothetical protein